MWRSGLLLIALFPAFLPAGACDFQFEHASTATYYRAEGWTLPGVTDFNPKGKVNTQGIPQPVKIPGAKIQLLPHDDDPYFIVEFPAQGFAVGNDRMKLRPMRAIAVIARYSIGGKVMAYSYGLTPVLARRENGHWIVQDEMACVFTATFIDDMGDGVFRVMSQGPLTLNLIPLWAKSRAH